MSLLRGIICKDAKHARIPDWQHQQILVIHKHLKLFVLN